MPFENPPAVSTNPFTPLVKDLKVQAKTKVPYPPGPLNFSLKRTKQMQYDPLALMLKGYSDFGPVYSLKLLTSNVVVLLGPEANHHLLVSNAKNFSWREGSMGNLIPLLGDGLLTIDGDMHRRSRKVMLPAFAREKVMNTYGVIDEEVEGAVAKWRAGQQIDIYTWTRDLALRIAMRALMGINPDAPGTDNHELAELFEQGLGFYSHEITDQMKRGPRTPWSRMQAAKRKLDKAIYNEIDRRRETGERGFDLISMLLDATDEDGQQLDRKHVRDEAMTLLFAGHDTTTSTVAFMFYELARNPEWQAKLRAEQSQQLEGRTAAVTDLMGETLPLLEQVLDETLRRYPPAWVGPRRAIDDFEVCGVKVPAQAPVVYSSWVSHHLPDVWDDPFAFKPERFAPELKSKLQKGQYVPFGAGSRTCIGMRFGQLEIRSIAARIVQEFDVSLPADYRLQVRQQPTIGPKQGMPLNLHSAGEISG